MTSVDKFFKGYEEVRHVAGGLRMLSRAFETTGNTNMAEELLSAASALLAAREDMFEGFHEINSAGIFSKSEVG